MTAKEIAKTLARQPARFGGRGRGAYVVLPFDDYQKLCDAVEDALDLMDLEKARNENGSDTPVAWEKVKRQLGLGTSKRSPRRSSATRKSN